MGLENFTLWQSLNSFIRRNVSKGAYMPNSTCENSGFKSTTWSKSRLVFILGIPFVFPQFGDWMYGPNGPPNNGFARISRWQLEKVCTGLPTNNEIV